jgi:hypothetical protein
MIRVSKRDGAMTPISFQRPKFIDNGAPKFTRIESVIDFGSYYELVFVNDQMNPPTRGAFRMARKAFEALCEHVERIALDKTAEIRELRPNESAAPDTNEPE